MQHLDRRRFLADTTTGLSAIALATLLTEERVRAETVAPYRPVIDSAAPHAARQAPTPVAAKRVLMIFCSGALSHIDTFDWKPELVKRHGQMMPNAEAAVTFQGENGAIAQPLFPFRPRGECGKMCSDLLPNLSALA
ncbi:MAG TPA: DUF1501 domain-containing protein, partial [Planctomycetaceae bacterium]|nr:DUF1501 domain-containing protein [Planctomycetaceae bacterium]